MHLYVKCTVDVQLTHIGVFYVEHVHHCVYNYCAPNTPFIDTLTKMVLLYIVRLGAVIHITHGYFRKKPNVDIPFLITGA